jgi:hypothetical protein
VIASGDSPEDVQISMTVLDENGNPDESKRVGSEPSNGPAPIPRSIDLPALSGHLFVPMYQLAASSKPGTVKERRITCTHKGQPVLETIFVLHAERDARSARLDKKTAALHESAQQMERSMEKTDEQKKSFRDEADALEAELRF